MKKPKIIAILGPTASGKTGLALQVAKKLNGEVINADSRTIYQEMNIGTAKPVFKRGQVVDDVLHWGFDLVSPDQHFQAYNFKEFAESKIADILERGKLPIIAGGTGLYIQGLVDNFDFEGDKAVEPKFEVLQIGILVNREELYKRTDDRVDQMIASGLVDEVRSLKEKYGCSVKSMTGIGYRQICQFLNGEVSLAEAIRIIKRDSRHYAKRQMTWFKRDDRIKWIKDSKEAMELIEKFLK
ncbi:hypothetical protein CO057_03545 [Candidatus Uhrbacteria bacterium CG_4_9_14_0_2_um_filter_41_50]|uniref:tRNA dimethylallyltransferase n=1 Tax=Candidatus Uhrbacteria bacterium CG_4_9_14_0_2_um_filter_41_50 TaxID=1975031 RepID=A0A2M8ENN9_9BACT|nr:MAG: hypothetical protein COZ45_02560 [Candidatus Uhrbacteria bacterium CG_4_10_14_3_um_filter_41_21]PIZ54260.1 MAG: hypothetical protein COY24_04405 [Candidatus Uhrbacteria bacterium CG_4_10_14_0_2_um_filter_41_21]PJB84462.1 MAG: hypothetical protein CO086_03495 [Candidatus Uhrbacteria bacterium CG_4_9_14_0_8_um_filter_41_16]PJC24372.1 MAG: hypothetical protein CO057_03545 [Candidatus Uhrbacteria bacterium CG_4_9_14_0_2_um_filter_41_50]PJE75342.1 MAG: hypothetical protein COV03_00660 [Candi